MWLQDPVLLVRVSCADRHNNGSQRPLVVKTIDERARTHATYLTYNVVFISEPLVLEKTCALSSDTQCNRMVHRHTHGDGVAHYDNLWNKSRGNLNHPKRLNHGTIAMSSVAQIAYLRSLCDRVWTSVHLLSGSKKSKLMASVIFHHPVMEIIAESGI